MNPFKVNACHNMSCLCKVTRLGGACKNTTYFCSNFLCTKQTILTYKEGMWWCTFCKEHHPSTFKCRHHTKNDDNEIHQKDKELARILFNVQSRIMDSTLNIDNNQEK